MIWHIGKLLLHLPINFLASVLYTIPLILLTTVALFKQFESIMEGIVAAVLHTILCPLYPILIFCLGMDSVMNMTIATVSGEEHFKDLYPRLMRRFLAYSVIRDALEHKI